MTRKLLIHSEVVSGIPRLQIHDVLDEAEANFLAALTFSRAASRRAVLGMSCPIRDVERMSSMARTLGATVVTPSRAPRRSFGWFRSTP